LASQLLCIFIISIQHIYVYKVQNHILFMGKVQDAVDWLKEKASKAKEKTKDTYGTGVEALNPGGIADFLKKKA